MKRSCIISALLLIAFCHFSFAVKAENSLVTDFSRYNTESAGLNGVGLSYRLVLRDSSERMLGMQFFINRLADRYNGEPAESRDRFYLYGVSLLRPLTPFGKVYCIQLIPAIGLAIQNKIHSDLNPDTLYYAFEEDSPASDPVCFYPSLEMTVKRLLYKKKLGVGLGVHFRYFLPLLEYTHASSKDKFRFGYGIAFSLFLRP